MSTALRTLTIFTSTRHDYPPVTPREALGTFEPSADSCHLIKLKFYIVFTGRFAALGGFGHSCHSGHCHFMCSRHALGGRLLPSVWRFITQIVTAPTPIGPCQLTDTVLRLSLRADFSTFLD